MVGEREEGEMKRKQTKIKNTQQISDTAKRRSRHKISAAMFQFC